MTVNLTKAEIQELIHSTHKFGAFNDIVRYGPRATLEILAQAEGHLEADPHLPFPRDTMFAPKRKYPWGQTSTVGLGYGEDQDLERVGGKEEEQMEEPTPYHVDTDWGKPAVVKREKRRVVILNDQIVSEDVVMTGS